MKNVFPLIRKNYVFIPLDTGGAICCEPSICFRRAVDFFNHSSQGLALQHRTPEFAVLQGVNCHQVCWLFLDGRRQRWERSCGRARVCPVEVAPRGLELREVRVLLLGEDVLHGPPVDVPGLRDILRGEPGKALGFRKQNSFNYTRK